jgi:hypothetical protein
MPTSAERIDAPNDVDSSNDSSAVTDNKIISSASSSSSSSSSSSASSNNSLSHHADLPDFSWEHHHSQPDSASDEVSSYGISNLIEQNSATETNIDETMEDVIDGDLDDLETEEDE